MFQIIILIVLVVAIIYFNMSHGKKEGFDVIKAIGLRSVVNRHKRNCRKLVSKMHNDYVRPCKKYLKQKKLI